ncbi:MAG: hypothetical protein ACOX7P_04450 [Oscillospiraceae bacterium]|jgi:hypothetical protein
MLFRKDIEPACAYCVNSDGEYEQLRCLRKNISVEPQQSCWSFKYDPLRRTPIRSPFLSEMDGEDFKL